MDCTDSGDFQSMAESNINISIADLPDDVLLHIFSFLDAISLCKVRRVCQVWNQLSTDEILWKHKLMSDVRTWKYISSTCIPDSCFQNGENTMPKHALYMRSSPEIQKWKRNFYQRTTLHQLTDLLRSFMPSKRFTFGVGASAMDSYGKGQSFFSRLLSFDAANVFQHCGQFPGRFKGHGGGFQFKYKRYTLELCLMYVAQRALRDAMTIEEKISQLKVKMNDSAYLQLLASLNGYMHTIDVRIQEQFTEAETVGRICQQAEEVALLDQYLKPGIPILILSMRKVDSDRYISSYEVSKVLKLESLSRPWMVSECSAQMIYRDIVDAVDWLIGASTP